MNLQETIKIHLPEAVIYEASFAERADGQALLLRLGERDLLAVGGDLRGSFAGEERDGFWLCPLSRENRIALNHAFPYTAPRALGRAVPTFGFGDRLGYANPVQLQSLAGTNFLPVLAQQSMRELVLMGRDYGQVIDVASWAAFREGWRQGFGADGDHLKTLDEVQTALDAGCSMITLDCSLALNQPSETVHIEGDYLDSEAVGALGLQYDTDLLQQLEQTYAGAIELVCKVFEQAIRLCGREIDFELSVDETEDVTTPEAHYYIANELYQRGIVLTSLAPRFVGEFQKAVDYRGDLTDFCAQLRKHVRIADHFGYKLSLHSASEKFSVFPAMAQETGGRCHIKTSGTSWLEAVECIAKADPALYRDMFRKALLHLDEAKGNYVVDCDPSKLPEIEAVSDADLPGLMEMEQGDVRQLMHITYGYILADEGFRGRIYRFMEDHHGLYEAEALELYMRHLAALR